MHHAKIQDYYFIREIKTWQNINHTTVHSNTYILKPKQQLLKIQKLCNTNKLEIYVIYTHTHTYNTRENVRNFLSKFISVFGGSVV